jgi:acetyl esterase
MENNVMPLDPQVQFMLQQMETFKFPPISSLEPAAARKAMQEMPSINAPLAPVAKVENRAIPGPYGEIPLRIYTPLGEGPFPILVFFHGGGWVLGGLDEYNSICHTLTNRAGCIVVSVDYHLAPEYKFPVAPDDCYTATQWVAKHAREIDGDPTRIALGGDSAGGNLTAVVAQIARDQHTPHIIFQLLIYPATNFTADTDSMKENGKGYFLTTDDMNYFAHHYLRNEEDKINPLASPMLAKDLSSLPPALIITAEFDPLRDEGELYGKRLQEADVPVIIHRYEGAIHGFVSMAPILAQGQQALDECSEALRHTFTQR